MQFLRFSLLALGLVVSHASFATGSFDAIQCQSGGKQFSVRIETTNDDTFAVQATLERTGQKDVALFRPTYLPSGAGSYTFESIEDGATTVYIVQEEDTQVLLKQNGVTEHVPGCKVNLNKLQTLTNVGIPPLTPQAGPDVNVVCSLLPNLFVHVQQLSGGFAFVSLIREDGAGKQIYLANLIGAQVTELSKGVRRMNLTANNGDEIRILSDAEIFGAAPSREENAGWLGKLWFSPEFAIKVGHAMKSQGPIHGGGVVCRDDN